VSAAGDSGSLWLDESTMRVIGLHFAGSNQPERALALDIQPVLDALNVDLLI
jgi:endonuclease G